MDMRPLPLHIDPVKFAEQRQVLDGFIGLKSMRRLAEVAQKTFDKERAEVHLEGGVDEQGTRFLKGKIKAVLPLICQRCMKTMEYSIEDDFLATPVSSEEEANLISSQYDPLILDENEISLLAFIEEELILALPIVPLHDENKCPVKRQLNSEHDERQQPFKNLDTLIKTK